jgi:hypothetical protein
MIPFTYLLGWKTHNKYYYGVRYADNCKPSDLWESYFSSSEKVLEFRKLYGEPDIIQVRKIFKTATEALKWETRVLSRLRAAQSAKWLNLSNGYFTGAYRGSFSDEHKKKLSDAAKKRKLSDAHKAALNAGRRNSKNSPEHQAAIRASRIGNKHSDATKLIISSKKKERSDISAIAIKAGKASAEKRKNTNYYSSAIHSENVKRGWEKRRMKQGGMV